MNGVIASELCGYGVRLRPIVPADLPSLRRWRNSDEVRLAMLTQTHISPAQQRRWYQHIYAQPAQRHWCVEVQGIRAGYANLKGFVDAPLNGQARADSGLYLGQTRVRHGLLAIAVALCQLDAAFEQLDITTIETQVKADNHSALRLNRMLGYQSVTHIDEWLTLTLTAQPYFAARHHLMRFFRHV
ncbi:GNAT family N-acetyltransferase [Celerinatantimonas yamalensis]|uniref:GNAT family N-acetyltransferase n=1 Tax=Celerinatantimonas yamalensis TaxID=559956 RepID=A0ABW9GAR8_9GAMM